MISPRNILSKLFTAAAIILSGAAVAGCSGSSADAPAETGGEAKLHLQVAMSTPQAVSRAAGSRADYSDPTGANEMMQELRIIIVRPNGIIEHNDHITEPFLNNPVITAGAFEYKVVSGETKLVYLIVNESATRTDHSGRTVKVVDYDFEALTPGSAFPETAVGNILINLGSNTETLNGVLPMSECHRVKVPFVAPQPIEPTIPTIPYKLFVTRAAVKFTLNITNSSMLNDFNIDEVRINKMSSKEFFLPRNTTYNDAGEITNYQVPNIGNNEYYTFHRTYSGVTAQSGGSTVTLPSFYLLEGKYADPNSPDGLRNYSLTLRMNGQNYTKYFPNLPQLPRNTHVVVNVDIKNLDNLDWQIDLRPYSSVVLNPDFGLPYPEAPSDADDIQQ